jgi:hypothetical protein
MIRKSSGVAVLITVAGILHGQVIAKPPAGAVMGLVKDDAGNPIIGAVVKVIDPGSLREPLQTLRTDAQGRFIAKSLAPGQYRLRAEARGFISVAHPIEVKPDVTLSFTFELKRLDTLAQQRDDRDDYRWLVRGSRRHVLRFNKNGEAPSDDFLRTMGRWRLFPSRGMIHWTGGILGASRSGAPLGTLSVAVLSELTPTTELLITGQLSGPNSPGRLEVVTSSSAVDDHTLTLGLGVATVLPQTSKGPGAPTKLLSLRVFDSWKVADSLSIVYGAEATKTVGQTSTVAVIPRVGVRVAAPGRSVMTAEWVPVRTQDVQGRFDYSGGSVLFTEPETPAILNGRVVADRSRRFHLQWEKSVSEASHVEAALFLDDIAGRGMSLVVRPHVGAQVVHPLALTTQARGLRVMYRHRLGESFQATVGYAVGQGPQLSVRGLDTPSQAVTIGFFQVFAARFDALVSPTRTRLSAHVRAARRASLFAIDPFYGRLPVLDPSVSLTVTQELPLVAVLPGHWEATVDLRNLLDLTTGTSSERGGVFLNRPHRFVRGSVSVRF